MDEFAEPESDEPKRGLTRRKVLKAVAAMGTSLGGYAVFGETNWLEVTHTQIGVRNLPEVFEGYKFALVSDIHWPEGIDRGFTKRIGDLIQLECVKAVLVPGDIVDEAGGGTVDLKGVFDNWTAPDGQFATLGNHDHWSGVENVKEQLRNHTPLQLLDNAYHLIEKSGEAIAIVGVDDYTDGFMDIDKAFQGLDPKIPRILMSHNPDVAHDMTGDYRVDLQVSGHMHGGQVNLFGWAPITPSKYGQTFVRGLVQGRKNLVYVTRGVCRTKVHVRFGSRPEVSIIELVNRAI